MELTILGASGGVGRHLVDQALLRGHDVRVVLRDPTRLPQDVLARLAVTRLDLVDAPSAQLAQVVDGSDAVLSALGARTAQDAGVLRRAALSTVAAMQATGVRRWVGVSAAPVGTVPSPLRPHPPRHDPGDDPLTRHLLVPLVKRFFGGSYADAAAMEDVIRTSTLDWTIVRPPRLTNRDATRGYRTAVDQNVRGGRHVRRADVADLMLHSLTDPSLIGHTVGVAS